MFHLEITPLQMSEDEMKLWKAESYVGIKIAVIKDVFSSLIEQEGR